MRILKAPHNLPVSFNTYLTQNFTIFCLATVKCTWHARCKFNAVNLWKYGRNAVIKVRSNNIVGGGGPIRQWHAHYSRSLWWCQMLFWQHEDSLISRLWNNNNLSRKLWMHIVVYSPSSASQDIANQQQQERSSPCCLFGLHCASQTRWSS
jgi:hypothetical protein